METQTKMVTIMMMVTMIMVTMMMMVMMIMMVMVVMMTYIVARVSDGPTYWYCQTFRIYGLIYFSTICSKSSPANTTCPT